MSLQSKEEIGMETHEKNDQFFRFKSGHGKCIIDGNAYEVTAGDAVIVPAGAKHNVINTSDTGALKLYTIYSPPNQHPIHYLAIPSLYAATLSIL
jgi:mannose-6-phosphate isomerase-like protein (cupin superfamily)